MKLKKEYNSVEVLKNGLDIVLLLEQDDYSSKDNFETTNSTNVLHESTDLQFSYDKRYDFVKLDYLFSSKFYSPILKVQKNGRFRR